MSDGCWKAGGRGGRLASQCRFRAPISWRRRQSGTIDPGNADAIVAFASHASSPAFGSPRMSASRRFLLLAALVVGLVPSLSWAQDNPNDAVIPIPRDANWMKRHESFNERVKQGNVDLIFIGDSITQGWEGAGRKVWEEYYAKRNAVNLGIGGDRTQHVLWRLDHGNIDGINPKLAVLMIGTNNSGANTSQQIADGIKAIVEKLRAKLPNTKVLILAIFPRADNFDAGKNKVNEGANEIVKKLADNKMVYY